MAFNAEQKKQWRKDNAANIAAYNKEWRDKRDGRTTINDGVDHAAALENAMALIRERAKYYKVCNKCKTEKDLSLFIKDGSKKDGHRTICKECYSIHMIPYRKSRRHTISIYDTRYMRERRGTEEYRLLSNLKSRSYKLYREDVLDRDGHRCALCSATHKLHLHHIVPVSIDPLRALDITNIVTLCIPCHKAAHAGNWSMVCPTIAIQLGGWVDARKK